MMHSGCIILQSPPQWAWGSISPHLRQHLLFSEVFFFFFFFSCHPNGNEVISDYGLIYIFLMTGGVEHLCICSLTICISSLETSIQVLCLFLIGLFDFCC